MKRSVHLEHGGPVALSPLWDEGDWLAAVGDAAEVVLVTRRGRRRAWWAADGGFGSREGRDQRDQ